LSYFDTFFDSEIKKRVLKTYPKEIQSAYKKYRERKGEQWFAIPTNISLCF
jgi:hypothetical protein